MRNIVLIALISLIAITGCKKQLPLEGIIEKSIQTYGGKFYKNSIIEFDFRGRHYLVERNNGNFLFKREYKDSVGVIREYFNKNGTFKEVDEKLIELSELDALRIRNSINSVVYFASLPYPLNDKAARKKLLREETYQGKVYHVIEVTFAEEGGGDDFDDRYIYWIDKKTFKMDYLAYYFHVNNGGSRFRVVHNERNVNGIIITDHDNYKADDLGKNEIENYLHLYKTGELKKLSEINLENPKVVLI